MRRIFHKVIVVLLLVLLVVNPVFAGGGKEDEKNDSAGSVSGGTASEGGTAASTGSTGATGSTGSSSADPEKKWIVSDGVGGTLEVPYVNEELVPAGAIGTVTYTDGNDVGSVKYFDDSESWLGQWIKDIADAIDQVVFRIALAIHPFPTSIFQLYGLSVYQSDLHTVGLKMSPTEDKIHNFGTEYLLISNDYYDGRHLDINRQSSVDNGISVSTGNTLNEWKLPIAEDENKTGEGMFQYTKWKTVVLLFACCFAAEILFMAVYGYATGSSEDGDSSLMKNLAKKIAVTLMLMVLVAALPFLLEAFRIGLFEIAESFYGEAAYKSYSELVEQKIIGQNDNPLKDDGTLKDANIFKLPGLFLRSMRDMFVRTTSDPMDRSLTHYMEKGANEENSKLQSLLVKGFVWILIIVYRFLVFFIALKATVHIAKNVLEVYLLLSIVMIFIPFSVFTPLKTIGSKCVMSLVSNLIECFIILVIIITIIPAIKVTIVSVLDYCLEISMPGTTMISTNYYKNYTDTFNLKMIAGDGYVAVMANTGMVGNKFAVCWTDDRKGYSSIPELKQIFEVENVWVVFDISNMAADPTTGSFTGLKKEHLLAADEIRKPIVENGYTLAYNDYVIFVTKNGESTARPGDINKIYLLPTEGTTNDLAKFTLAGQFAEAMYFTGATQYDWNPEMPGREKKMQKVWNRMLNPTNEERNYMTILTSLAYLLTPHNPTDVTFTDDPQEYVDPVSSTPTDYKNSGKMTADTVTAAMFTQLTLIFLGLFLPSFFVQQSTQMTNALLNGTAGMESLANAMNQTLSKSFKTAGKIMAMPFSVAGNAAGALLGGKPGGDHGNEQSTLSSMTDKNNE